MDKVVLKLHRKDFWEKLSLDAGVIYFSGYITVGQMTFSKDTISTYFLDDPFSVEKIKEWSGEFACIFQTKDKVVLVCDRKRSIPLFYCEKEATVVVTDQVTEDEMTDEIQEVAAVEFLLTGYVANDRTLYKNLFQAEAGQIVDIAHGSIKKKNYFHYYHNPVSMELEEGIETLTALFHQVFQKLIDRHKNSHIMLPLSGGYDSRIIALLLKEYGVERVSSFTYGRMENKEAQVSKEIAGKLGIPWKFIEYTRNDWYQWYRSKEWEDYRHFATNASSMAHLQDWPAVHQMVREQGEPYVFIPGHSGDFIAGSHLPYELISEKQYTLDEVVAEIIKKHHRLWEWKNPQTIVGVKKEIIASLNGFAFENREEASALFEYWDWKERQAKFIINSVRVYEYYDQKWEIPLWDDALVNFFLTVPVDLRYKKFLYDATLHHMYPNYFAKPTKAVTQQTSLKSKYGAFYPILKRAYNKKRVYQQYYKNPMEWFGIYGSYLTYINQIAFSYQKNKYNNPYNINSFLVKDYLQNLKG